MVEFSKKRTTRVFVRNSQEESTSVPQRELKKRKNVRFEDEKNDNAQATSDFVLNTNKEWQFVATCFDLREEKRAATRDGDKELLVLCNYFDQKENSPSLTDDSDDSARFDVFVEQGMCIAWQVGSSNSTVSTLRLSSMLRLESRQQVAYEKSDDHHLVPFVRENDSLEKAFQGCLPCSNFQKSSISRCSSKAEENERFGSSKNFWEVVEF